jgi:transposase
VSACHAGSTIQVTTAPADADGLGGLARQTTVHGQPVRAAIESMNGARFVHDQLELAGWQVTIADAQKVNSLAPLAGTTDRIDARCWPSCPAATWFPRSGDPPQGAGRAGASTVPAASGRHRTALKNRIHATLLAFGKPCPVSDLFGAGGRALLACLALPEPWIGNLTAALASSTTGRPDRTCERTLRRLGADHRSVPLLMTAPGIGWVLGDPIAAEVGDITRFPSPKQLCGSTGLCPRVDQSGRRDQRGPLAKNGPP